MITPSPRAKQHTAHQDNDDERRHRQRSDTSHCTEAIHDERREAQDKQPGRQAGAAAAIERNEESANRDAIEEGMEPPREADGGSTISSISSVANITAVASTTRWNIRARCVCSMVSKTGGEKNRRRA